jgi:hypothetical protein
MLTSPINIMLQQAKIEARIRGRRIAQKMALESVTTEAKKVTNKPFSLMPILKVEKTEPKVVQFGAQPKDNDFIVTPP